MEKQSCFDLNLSLARWREELASQPGISSGDLRELETHLLEYLETSKKSGFEDSKAFERAVKQMGSAQDIGAEFQKLHPFRSWRARVFLMAFAIFSMVHFYMPLTLLAVIPMHELSGMKWTISIFVLMHVLPVCLLVGIALGYFGLLARTMAWFLHNKVRFLIFMAGSVLVNFLCWNQVQSYLLRSAPNGGFAGSLTLSEYLLRELQFHGVLLGVLFWLHQEGRNTFLEFAKFEERARRHTMFLIVAGGLFFTFFNNIISAIEALWSRLTQWLYWLVYPEMSQEFLHAISPRYVWWIRAFALLCVAILAVRGSFTPIATWLNQKLNGYMRLALAVTIFVLPYFLHPFSNLKTHHWLSLVTALFVPLIYFGIAVWLSSSLRRVQH